MESNRIQMFTNADNGVISEDENRLPDVLQRLEIFPVSQQRKTDKDSSTASNPFCSLESSRIERESCDAIELFGPKCSCSERPEDATDPGNGAIEHTILNPTQFKHRLTSGKFALREPILKVIRTCRHHSHGKHKLATNSRRPSHSKDCISDLDECPPLEALVLEEGPAVKCVNQSQEFAASAPNCLDFKALVQECDIISSAVSSGNSQPIAGHISMDKRKRGKQFTTIQSVELRKGKDSRKLKKSQSKAGTQSLYRQDISGASAGSSCSQQARMNATTATACDVTIDELASYFETFVHIPKKMSSMAEMMYI